MVQRISFTTGSDGKKNLTCKLQKKCVLSESEIHSMSTLNIPETQLLQHLYTCSSNMKEVTKPQNGKAQSKFQVTLEIKALKQKHHRNLVFYLNLSSHKQTNLQKQNLINWKGKQTL